MENYKYRTYVRFVFVFCISIFLSACEKSIVDFVSLLDSQSELQNSDPVDSTTTTTTTTITTTTTTLPSSLGSFSLIKDINQTGSTLFLASMTVTSGHLYFEADDGVNGKEIWATDGTQAGTTLVSDYVAGAASAEIDSLAVIGDSLVASVYNASGGNDILLYDAASTSRTLLFTSNSWAGRVLSVSGGKVAFQGQAPATGHEPYITDGTLAGTQIILDTNPGVLSLFDYGSEGLHFNSVSNSVYFINERDNYEIWVSDYNPSNPSGTFQLSSSIQWVIGEMANVGSNTYFSGADSTGNFRDLYVTDGTVIGTGLVKAINLVTNANVQIRGVVNSKVILTANDGTNGEELWVSDGTTVGTVLLKDINLGAASTTFGSEFLTVGTNIYFKANDGTSGDEVWISDGTPGGTKLLKDINSGVTSSSPTNFISLAGKVYFVANDGTHGKELWQTDGTSSGTIMMTELNEGPGSSEPEDLVVFNSSIFLTATDSTGDLKLYKFSP